MRKYKLYLFDFDGTLFDTTDGLYYVFKTAFKAVGGNIKPDDVIYLSRVPLQESYIKMGGDPQKMDDFVKNIEDALDDVESISTIKKYHDSDELFAYLRDNKIDAGIVTSNRISHVYKTFEYLNIDLKTFKVYVGNDNCKKFKPNPAPLLLALQEFGYKGDLKDVVYIGDSFNDCKCAINAGVDYFLIDHDHNSNYDFKKIHNLMDLFK